MTTFDSQNRISINDTLFVYADPFGYKPNFPNGLTGYLTKQGHNVKNWKRRYCVLKDGELKYYTDESRVSLKGSYKINSQSIVSYINNEYDGHDNILTLKSQRTGCGVITLFLSALTLVEREKWYQAFSEIIRGGFPVVLQPEIWSTHFVPIAELSVKYGECIVDDGNILKPSNMDAPPCVQFNLYNKANNSSDRMNIDCYTLLMVDIDYPSRADINRRMYLHWAVTDIQINADGSANFLNSVEVLLLLHNKNIL